MISSTSNSQIKNVIQLQKKAKARREQGAFVIEGAKMFEEAKVLKTVIRAYVAEHFFQEKLLENTKYLYGIEYEVVSDDVFHHMSETVTPQGIMAIVKMPFYQLKGILEHPKANLILLENLRDPGNLGTIIRTAEGAGVTGVILSKESVDIFNPKVIRATMGSIYRMPFLYVNDFLETLVLAKEKGVILTATSLFGEKDYAGVDYSKKSGIIIGNEAQGITKEAENLADCLVKIPMEGQVESLNAAVAAAVMMYEVYRQRRK